MVLGLTLARFDKVIEMAPTSVFICGKKSQQFPIYPAAILKLVNGFPLHLVWVLFKLVFFFLLGLRQNESACKTYKSGFFVPYSSVMFLYIIFISSQSQVFKGLLFLMQDLTNC